MGFQNKQKTDEKFVISELDNEGMFLSFKFLKCTDIKKIPNLISPLVDDRHVDIIYKNGHFLSSLRSVSGSHPFIHIALYGPLKDKWRSNDI